MLTGGVGSGKTTFLRRFATVQSAQFVEHYCVWLHVDFLPIGNPEAAKLDSEIRNFTYGQIRLQLGESYGDKMPGTGEEMRELFADQIQEAKLTRLHGIPEDSQEWNSAVGELVSDLYQADEVFTRCALRRLRRRGLRPVVVLDNTDQLGEEFQERVFLFAQKLADDYAALCIVALREEKYFAAFRRGRFDAFGDRRFRVGSPELSKVIGRRIQLGQSKFDELREAGGSDLKESDFEEIDRFLRALRNSTYRRDSKVVRMLACVSNGDMRHALDMFREFVSSGNTNVRKILDIVRETGGYSVPFHEFAKSAILASRRYFHGSVSHIVNVFVRSETAQASHLTASRILGRLASAEGVASRHGEGYVSTKKLLREYRQSFGPADDFVQWSGELLRRGLVESEPPKVEDVRHTEALRISAAGMYYWRYLIRSFAYIDLVFVDTPISDNALARSLGRLAGSSDMRTGSREQSASWSILKLRRRGSS